MTMSGADRRASRTTDERGVVLVAALGLTVVLSGLALAVAGSGQMSALTSALASHGARSFYTADGAVFHSLGDSQNFVPFMAPRVSDLQPGATALEATVTARWAGCRTLPGNLLVRTKDGNLRAAQFGQSDGIGQMFFFTLDGQRKVVNLGMDATTTVSMQAAKPGTSTSCDPGNG